VLLFNDGASNFTPASFRVSPKERFVIGVELLAIVGLHAGLIVWLDGQPLKLLLGYFIPIWIGYAGAIGYIYTNHLLGPLTEINDPLANSLSLRLPKILDLLHLNFSYHTEHHIFPGLNSSYYPQVRHLLQQHYPERYQLLDGAEAWRLLLSTPRHYRDSRTLTTWNGDRQMATPLPGAARAAAGA
jgi:fatty acid desaturase